MISYVTLGTRNKPAALEFYDTILGALGGKRVFANEKLQFYSNGKGLIGVGDPYEGEASIGNGTMIALAAPDRAHVDKVYQTALSLGAKCEGPPGERMPTFYGAYFRDLDGNKLCVCHFVM